ncbi:MAG: hypothetical protein P4L26_06635 [Terracidiphilus sp.]|nr:hypothetical protein [Terracidiphilus sp.]
MRRVLSILLVLSFSLGPLAAMLEAGDDARLPACCRRHGTHHCAMSTSMVSMLAEAAPGRSVLTAPATCPAFPGSLAAIAPAPQALAAASTSLPALLALPYSAAALHVSAQVSQICTRAGRGPPASLLA